MPNRGRPVQSRPDGALMPTMYVYLYIGQYAKVLGGHKERPRKGATGPDCGDLRFQEFPPGPAAHEGPACASCRPPASGRAQCWAKKASACSKKTM